MADQVILREMLVKVGWIYDRVSQRDIQGVLTNMETAARRLTAALAATTTGLGIATVAASRMLDRLYYVSQRTGSSVDSIRAFGFAVGQMGGTAEDAQASLENLARAMRDNPGMRAFVQGLVGPNVNTNNTVQTMQALAARFRTMAPHVARLYAGALGIDENTLRALIEGTGKFEDRYRQMARRMGIDSAQSAEHARTFQNALRELQLIGIFAIEKLVIALAKIAPSMVEGAEDFAKWLERTLPKVDAFVQSIGGWEPVLIVVGTALTLHLLSPLTKIAAVLASLLLLRVPPWLLVAMGVPVAAAVGIGMLSQHVDTSQTETPEERAANPNRPRPGGFFGPAIDWIRRATGPRLTSEQQGHLGNLAQRFFEMAGWQPHQAAGLVANIQHESGFRESAVGDGGMSFGIAQWNRDRLANLGAFASRLRGRPTNPRETTFFEQLQFMQHELTRGGEVAAGRALAATTSAAEAGAVVSRQYERPRADEGFTRGRTADEWFRRTQQGRAGREVIVNQNVDITVNGATDPTRTGEAVRRAMQTQSSDLVRNMRGATR